MHVVYTNNSQRYKIYTMRFTQLHVMWLEMKRLLIVINNISSEPSPFLAVSKTLNTMWKDVLLYSVYIENAVV